MPEWIGSGKKWHRAVRKGFTDTESGMWRHLRWQKVGCGHLRWRDVHLNLRIFECLFVRLTCMCVVGVALWQAFQTLSISSAYWPPFAPSGRQWTKAESANLCAWMPDVPLCVAVRRAIDGGQTPSDTVPSMTLDWVFSWSIKVVSPEYLAHLRSSQTSRHKIATTHTRARSTTRTTTDCDVRVLEIFCRGKIANEQRLNSMSYTTHNCLHTTQTIKLKSATSTGRETII